jgi:hypothetical protein
MTCQTLINGFVVQKVRCLSIWFHAKTSVEFDELVIFDINSSIRLSLYFTR